MSFINERVQPEGLTFDDVLLVPAFSEVLPREVSLETRFSRNIKLNIPIVSAAMSLVFSIVMNKTNNINNPDGAKKQQCLYDLYLQPPHVPVDRLRHACGPVRVLDRQQRFVHDPGADRGQAAEEGL